MTITTQKIHAVLRKTGAQKSKWMASGRIRGYGYSTASYVVRKSSYDGEITVEHYFNTSSTISFNPEKLIDARINMLKKYQKALIDAGINCYPDAAETMLIVGEE